MKIFKPTTKNTGNKVGCSFSILVAKEIGIDAAIILEMLNGLCLENQKRGIGDKVFLIAQEIVDLLPFLNLKQVRYAIEKLEKSGYLEVGKIRTSAISENHKKIQTDIAKSIIKKCSNNESFSLTKIPNSGVKEKPSPHTPYKKKDKEEYILSSESDNKLSSSSDNNIQSFNNFFPPFIPQVPAEPSQKEKKEVLQTQKKDVFEEFLTNTIYREVVMKSYGIDEKTLDYCINQARKKSSCMIDGVTRREAQFKVKYELDNIPVVKGKLFDRKQAFYNEILNCANQQNLDRDFATWFYCKWSHLAIPELEIMMFEKEAKDKSWDTFRMLKMSYLSYKRKNEKYY